MAKINKEIFREYDIRGVVDKDLTDETLELIGKSYGTLLARIAERDGRPTPTKVVVGRDVRISSAPFAAALIRGIASTGLDVVDVGIVPTPTLYFSVGYLNVDGGMEVTASHNPPEFNGLKSRKMITGAGGELINAPLSSAEVQELYSISEAGDFKQGSGKVTQQDTLTAYINYINDTVKLARPMNITVDSGNGACGPTAMQLYTAMGCKVDGLFIEPDGRFPNHVPNPIKEENMRDLQARIKETGNELGIALDGDGDRLGVVDNYGEILWADEYLILLARQVLEKGPATIIYDVKCGMALIEDIAKHGGNGVMWKTGYTNIFAKRAETGAPLAGEFSGHIFFNDPLISFDDGIYAGARMLQFLSQHNQGVRELMADVPKYFHTPEGRMDCEDSRKFAIVKELQAYFSSKYQTIDIDGVRIVWPDGWALVRASNTEPSLTDRFEAKTEARLQEIMGLVRDKLKEYPEVHINF
jgi:phosphomannomutase